MSEDLQPTLENSYEVPMSISARVIYQLGEELISDEFVALGELIKNSYDADCRKVVIKVDTKAVTPFGQGRITISDNGNGMVPSTIKNSFLRISSHFKKVEKFSPFFNRRTLGNKGLGRLSIQRLGNHVTVSTSPRIERLSKIAKEEDFEIYKNFNEYNVTINWLDFRGDNEDKDLSNVKASVELKNNEKPKLGTTLIIEGIRNLGFWDLNKKTETKIKTEIFGMVNPFLQNTESRFKVTLEIDDKKITNDDIEESFLSLISDVEVEFSVEKWILNLKILIKKKYSERLMSETIKKMINNGFEHETLRNYDDKEIFHQINLESNFQTEYPFLNDIFFHHCIDIQLNRKIKAYPGNFKGKLYASDQSANALTEDKLILNENGHAFSTNNEIKSILKASQGIYLFRNDFRILPYGPEKDWFKFTYYSQRVKNTIFKGYNVSGYVDLDGQTSEGLQEQTNRQGLIEDEYGNNFLVIIQDVIANLIFREDVKLRYETNVEKLDSNITSLKSIDGHVIFRRIKMNPEEKNEIFQKIETEANTLKSLVDNENSGHVVKISKQLKTLKDTTQKEEKFNKQEKFRYEQEINQLKSLIGLAGQGIIVESLTHELHKIESSIAAYARESKKELQSKYIEDMQKQKINRFQDAILHEITFLQMQLKHLEPTYRKNRNILSEMSLKSLLRELYLGNGPMAQKAKKNNITVEIIGDDILLKSNKGILVTIFDNIFLNSLYWAHKNNSNELFIIFELDVIQNTVVVYDSGPGFHKDIVNKMFEPYESMKPEGRGLGLYIVGELLRSLNGKIEVVKKDKNLLGNFYKLKLEFFFNKE
ncbi:sensor histidine kinase [Oceanobacillus sp. CFH 90083]|uniref:sensor histidine kinase n=1 Tax=Oceanobacillus sp. CFH 90083 TaxID=2592336 RepID=UPI00128E451A|nr:sensor histidine kinase [Oceanobacillus sp. CFH 90083]